MLQYVYRGLQFILESLALSFLTVSKQLKLSHKHRAEQLMHVNHDSPTSLCRHSWTLSIAQEQGEGDQLPVCSILLNDYIKMSKRWFMLPQRCAVCVTEASIIST